MIRSALTSIVVTVFVLFTNRVAPAQELHVPAAVFQQQDLDAVFENSAELLLADQSQPTNQAPATVSPFAVADTSPDSFRMANLDNTFDHRLANNFTADPSFKDGIIIVNRDVAMKIGGYVKTDLITDLDSIGSTDTFDTVTIPTSGESHRNVRFHARQTRLSLDTRWRVNGRVARAFVESDFFGGDPNGNSALRLRHAYGKLGYFTAGQTWTTFTDPSAVPQTLDFEGAVSNVNRRQALVRWDQPILTDGLSLAVALEDPQTIIISPPLITGTARTQSPDFVSRLRLERDWGNLQAAFLLRELGFQPTDMPVITNAAWGFNFSGSLNLDDRTNAYYQLTFGEGIGSYRGSPDVIATGPSTAEILPMFGWMIGVHHEWNDRLTSNVTFSQLSLNNLPGQDPDNLHNTTYLAANLIANPYKRVFCGVEYLFGTREDISGASGSDHRIQASFGFYLP